MTCGPMVRLSCGLLCGFWKRSPEIRGCIGKICIRQWRIALDGLRVPLWPLWLVSHSGVLCAAFFASASTAASFGFPGAEASLGSRKQ